MHLPEGAAVDPAETAAEQPAQDAAEQPAEKAEVDPAAATAPAAEPVEPVEPVEPDAAEPDAVEPEPAASEIAAPETIEAEAPEAAETEAAETETIEPATEPADAEPPAEPAAPLADEPDASSSEPDAATDGAEPVADTPPAAGADGSSEPASGVDADAAAIPPPESAAARAGLRSGQIVIATVDAVDADEVSVTLPDGAAGVIGKRHLSANGQIEPSELLSPGDQVEASVLVRDDPKGRIVLSRAWALKQRAWEKIEAALKSHQPVTGQVTSQVKGGLVVDVGTRAFLPASHVDLHHVDDLAPFIGQPIEALVAEADRANDKIVLSRRNLLRQHERAKANEFAATLAAGQVHRGRVSLLTDFGAFVDIAGVRGLVHLSELSWSRVERAGDVVSVGEEIEVKVLGIKPGKKLSLSLRALNPDPLTTVKEGEILPGVVTRLADFGAFVRVASGAEGLVHVTELAEYRVHAPEEVVAPGDEVLVKVLRVDRRRRRLDLSVNQAVLHQ